LNACYLLSSSQSTVYRWKDGQTSLQTLTIPSAAPYAQTMASWITPQTVTDSIQAYFSLNLELRCFKGPDFLFADFSFPLFSHPAVGQIAWYGLTTSQTIVEVTTVRGYYFCSDPTVFNSALVYPQGQLIVGVGPEGSRWIAISGTSVTYHSETAPGGNHYWPETVTIGNVDTTDGIYFTHLSDRKLGSSLWISRGTPASTTPLVRLV